MIKPVHKPAVETIYRAHIQWLYYDGNDDAVEDRLIQLKQPKSLDVQITSGGPCSAPYVSITGERRSSVEKFAGKVLRLLTRYKGMEIESGIL